MSSGLRSLAAGLFGALALAGPAGASTVSLGYALDYEAAPGEANNLTVAFADAPVGRTVLHDGGATITAGDNCQSLDAHTATCVGAPIGYSAIWIRLGDLNDTARFVGDYQTWTSIDGGPGDDVLIAPAGGADLSGGPGDDRLIGGAAPDILDGGPGADDERGGPGQDESSDYTSRTTSVHVSLDDVADDGAPGEHDNIHSDVEDFGGGSGNDHLVGSAAANIISTGGGDDHVDAGAGNDVVLADQGAGHVDVRDTAGADAVHCYQWSGTVLTDALDTTRDCPDVQQGL